MKKGDLVLFPCATEGYANVEGLLLRLKDNPSDLKPGSFIKVPRKVAYVLYKGQVHACWEKNMKMIDSAC